MDMTHNQVVAGSIPAGPTLIIKDLRGNPYRVAFFICIQFCIDKVPTIKKLSRQPQRVELVKENFYTGRPWRRLRAMKLRKNPICEVSIRKGLVVKATTVDHRLSRRFWPELEYDLDNLISMTTSAHNRKRAIESTISSKEQYIKIFGPQGEGVLNV